MQIEEMFQVYDVQSIRSHKRKNTAEENNC